MYIHELQDWPQFTWKLETIHPLIIQLRHKQGLLMGGMNSIGFPIQRETLLQTLTSDVMKSSQIEGEILDQSLVRSSVARHLGMEKAALDKVDRNVEGVVEMMLDATQRFDEPLTKERLLLWHTKLFTLQKSGHKKIRTGAWRTGSVKVVSGLFGEERVHFKAPDSQAIDQDMAAFLDWINHENALDLVLKAAIAHLWFLTIHPFEDGNGRIGRAIADLLLARSEKSSHRFYSLSSQIQAERKSYYAILEKTQKEGLNITPWIEWFFACLNKAIEKALSTFDLILDKERVWDLLTKISLNSRQKKVLNRLLDGFDGNLTSSKWAKIAKCSQDTAHRDITDLIHKDILKKNSLKGKNTSYSLAITSV